MKVYMAICNTADPEIVNSESRDTVIGVFSTHDLAESAFIRETKYEDWTSQHTCYQGIHSIREYEVDKWYPFGK